MRRACCCCPDPPATLPPLVASNGERFQASPIVGDDVGSGDQASSAAVPPAAPKITAAFGVSAAVTVVADAAGDGYITSLVAVNNSLDEFPAAGNEQGTGQSIAVAAAAAATAVVERGSGDEVSALS